MSYSKTKHYLMVYVGRYGSPVGAKNPSKLDSFLKRCRIYHGQSVRNLSLWELSRSMPLAE